MENTSPYFKYVMDLLAMLVEKDGSDLFITVGAPPSFKIHGDMVPAGSKPLTLDQVEEIVLCVMNEKQRGEFRETKECNFGLGMSQVGRFRMNAYVQRGAPGLVARVINTTIPTIESLNLPQTLKRIVMEKRGLVLMVGATGSGKSTSLASMIDFRNENSRGHIITIEDPIEFVHPHKNCLVMQREVGVDTDNWFAALKNTLRQAPDVIFIGEIRERDTMDYAVVFSETGHLCLATLHANNSNQALDRIINFFPSDRRDQLLMDLSLNIKAIVSQRLVPMIGGGRIPAVEILLGTPFVQDLIHRGAVHEIKPVMAKSRDLGMQTFDQSLFDLVAMGKVEPAVALRYADSSNDLRLMIKNLDMPGIEGFDKAKDLSLL